MLTRRDLLRLGLLGSPLVMAIGSRGLGDAPVPDEGGPRLIPVSPPTRPFIHDLPISPIKQPVAALSPAPDPAQHQLGFSRGFPLLYAVHQMEALHQFHPDLPNPSVVWGYDGLHPGPTFMARYGQPALVRFFNDLPTNHVGFGVPETTTHLHNSHTASESDGNPADFFFSGQFKDNLYQNFPAGDDPREKQSTFWYHDHRFGFTAQNVYKGLAGLYLIFDEVDSGDEQDTHPNALRLPSGPYDIPLIFNDRLFDADGQLFFDTFGLDGLIGDKMCVNGAIQPVLRVARRKYRFRLLDGGPSRFWQFFLSNGQPMTLIATDGGLLPRPMQVDSVLLSVAQRREVIIDFSHASIGDQIFLVNRLEQKNGRGPTGKLLNPGTPVLRFDVDRDAPDPSQVPNHLRDLPPVNLNEVVQERFWLFERRRGAWQVNHLFFDPQRVDARPKRGTAEIWTLKNGGGGWSHPIHIHLELFQILSRNGLPPGPLDQGRMDTVTLGPGDEVKLFTRFRNFVGKYPIHCHNTIHEDHEMMARWDSVP
jgi:FtsP/CotA-like multicopper oxidase with cupredoxin domain